MQPLSNDLRKRILDAVDNREGSRRKLAARFKVNTSTITKLLRLRRETGSFEPRPHGGGVAPTLDHDALERLRDARRGDPRRHARDAPAEDGRLRQPDDHLPGLAEARPAAQEEVPARLRAGHARGPGGAPRVPPRRSSRSSRSGFVFVDETGVTTAMTPAYGRAPQGERVESSAPASWESVTVIAAMGLDGVRAPLAFEGAVNAATFLAYVEQVLVPALHRGDVVVFDNLSSHLSPAVFEAIERAGASVLAAAAVQPGLQPDRGDVLEVQGVPPPGRGEGQGAPVRRHRRGTTRGHAPRTSSAGSGTPDCASCKRDPL